MRVVFIIVVLAGLTLVYATGAAQAAPSRYIFVGDRYAVEPSVPKIPRPRWTKRKHTLHKIAPRRVAARHAKPHPYPRHRSAPPSSVIPPAPLDAPPLNEPMRALYLFFASLFPPREVVIPVPEPARTSLLDKPQNLLVEFMQSLFRPLSSCHGWETTHPRVRKVVEDAARHFRSTAVIISCNRTRSHQVAIYRRMGRKPAMGSWHIKNAAADFKVVGVNKHALHAYVRSHKLAGGVGLYAGWDSIHVDAGPHRSWCWGCGKKSGRKVA